MISDFVRCNLMQKNDIYAQRIIEIAEKIDDHINFLLVRALKLASRGISKIKSVNPGTEARIDRTLIRINEKLTAEGSVIVVRKSEWMNCYGRLIEVLRCYAFLPSVLKRLDGL